MALASATPDGIPSVRIVLCRGLDDDGIRFFTNYESRKGQELEANARAAAVFHWRELESEPTHYPRRLARRREPDGMHRHEENVPLVVAEVVDPLLLLDEGRRVGGDGDQRGRIGAGRRRLEEQDCARLRERNGGDRPVGRRRVR